MDNKKFIISIMVCAIVFGGGGYYLGTKKDSSNKLGAPGNTNGGFTANRQGGQMGSRGNRMAGNFAGGEIVNIDAESITVKTQDNSSKIVFYSTNTPITKMASGTVSDLISGKSIIVNGKANPDGSVTAESIQLRGERGPSR